MTEEGWWNRQRETEEEWLERAARVASGATGNDMPRPMERIGLVTHGGFRCHAALCPVWAHEAAESDVVASQYWRSRGSTFMTTETSYMQYFNRVEHLPSGAG